jgi:hypothetical protein
MGELMLEPRSPKSPSVLPPSDHVALPVLGNINSVFERSKEWRGADSYWSSQILI